MTIPANNEQITLSSRLRYRSVGNEGVLINLDSGRVIVVNEVGLLDSSATQNPEDSRGPDAFNNGGF